MRILCVDPVCRDCATSSPPLRIHPDGDPTSRIEPEKDAEIGATFEACCNCGSVIMVRSDPPDFAVDSRRAFLSKHLGAGHTVTKGVGWIPKIPAKPRRKAKS